MKKKFGLMLMAGVMAVSMCACGSNSDTAEKQTEAVNENVAEGVTIPEYTSLTVQVDKAEVTDDDILSYINSSVLTYYPVTDRAVAEGDTVTIDYVGKLDGEAFEGGSAEGYALTIGSGTFIEGFESGLIGVMPGETVDLELSFPTNYHASDLAGEEVVFTVTVHNIRMTTDYDSVTPEQLALISDEYATKEDVWAAASKNVEDNAEATYKTNVANAIIEKLMAESTITTIPEDRVAIEVQNYTTYMETVCQSYYGMELEAFITTYYGMTMDEYNAQIRQMSEETVKQYMVIEEVAKAEGIEITEEMMLEKAAQEATEYGYASGEELLASIGETTYRAYMLQEQVMNRLMDMVTVEPVPAAEAATEAATTAQ